MLTVYAIPVSLYCAKLRILLRHKGLEWREVPPPGGYGSDEYKTIVPSGNLPALDDGGLLVGDCEAIAEYLNEKNPHPPMLPDNAADRAKVRELSRFHDTRLEPEVRKLFAHINPAERDSLMVADLSLAIKKRMAQLTQLLEQYPSLPADMLTFGDCGIAVTFTWIELLDRALKLDIDWPVAIVDYRVRISAIPAVHKELASYRETLETWFSRSLAS